MDNLNKIKKTPTVLKVAVGIIINDSNQILLTQRQKHQSYSNYWEFPGGKIEGKETPHCGLIRELDEEIGIVPLEAMPLITVLHEYPDYSVHLNVFWIKFYQGEPFGKEGQSLIWCAFSELKNYALLPANDIILKALENIPHFD